ncbi:MAG: MBL fold metallo-hydrolase [Alphaproteobacteria bacterium]|jgi:L-ascorbate metabolism protein UlaG (beta-lactamase superfamily)|nr:MBL fold metallo-hydrolase [Alphaproteobacteria bacterium]
MEMKHASKPPAPGWRWKTVLILCLALATVQPGGAAGLGAGVVAQATDARTCAFGMVRQTPAFRTVSLQKAAAPWGHVRLTYRGHSGFLIETPGGASAVTDYNGVHVPLNPPDIVTMNNSHSSHYTDVVDPVVRFVLRGWDPAGGVAEHDIEWQDLRVFNVPTNVFESGSGLTNGNSIFVFQTAGLCLGHLGHLHHVLGPNQLRRLGRIDVLFVPIDGSMTMSHDEALGVIEQISPKLVVPMHFQFPGSAEAFTARAQKLYKVKTIAGPTMEISRRTLPASTEVVFLRPY